MRRPVATALVLAAAASTGCGEPDARDAVNDYVRQANAVQERFDPALRRANAAYSGFAKGTIAPDTATRALRRAERDIRAARNALAALRAPKEARRLHAHLQRLYDLNLGFADETAQLAAYGPAAARVLVSVNDANRRLGRQLGRASEPRAQVRALERFTASLDRTIERLRALEVPYVLLPSHGDQVRSVRRTRAVADRLRRALAAQDAERVARLLLRFREDARSRRPRRGLARQAVSHYSRRYRDVVAADADVRREQARLAEVLG